MTMSRKDHEMARKHDDDDDEDAAPLPPRSQKVKKKPPVAIFVLSGVLGLCALFLPDIER